MNIIRTPGRGYSGSFYSNRGRDRGTEWNGWELDNSFPGFPYLTRSGLIPAADYPIGLDRARTCAGALDSLIHASKYCDGDDAALAGLVRAMDDVMNLQSSMCSFGRPRRMPSRELARRAAAAAAGWPAGDGAR